MIWNEVHIDGVREKSYSFILFTQMNTGSTLEISSSTETRKSSHATATAPHRKSSSETPPTSHSVTTTRRKKSKKKVTVPSKLKIKVSRNIDNTIINNTIINNTIINNTIINNIIKDSRIPSTSTATSTEGASNQTLRTNDFSELSQSHQQYSNNDRGGDFYDIGLRWHNICEDPIDEFRRIEAYKANRRLRYNNANDTKIALLTIKERKF